MTMPSTLPRTLACGVDVIDLDQMARALRTGGEHFLQAYYTSAEQAYCQGDVSRLAARWAAKEAVAKALGTGMQDVDLRDIEIVVDALGQPQVHLHLTAATRAGALQLDTWAVSLSHSGTTAIAMAVATRSFSHTDAVLSAP